MAGKSAEEIPMTMELEYNRDLYGVEHEAGPFEITADLIQIFNRSIGETNPMFTDAATARAAGYTGVLAPPTLVTMLVRNVELPDIELKFRRHALPRRPAGPVPRANSGGGLPAGVVPPERGLPQNRAQRHHGLHRLGDHLHQPGRGGGGRRAGILRIARVRRAMVDGKCLSFEDIDLGDEIGPVELVATDENVATFCELWGNPMPNRFTSQDMAEASGLPGPIVPGVMSMAIMGQALTDWAGPESLKDLDLVFRQPVPHNKPLLISATGNGHPPGGRGESG